MKGKPINPADPRIPITNGGSSSIHPEPPSSAIDVQNSPASVADAASADPANLQQQLAAQKDDYLRHSRLCTVPPLDCLKYVFRRVEIEAQLVALLAMRRAGAPIVMSNCKSQS